MNIQTVTYFVFCARGSGIVEATKLKERCLRKTTICTLIEWFREDVKIGNNCFHIFSFFELD